MLAGCNIVEYWRNVPQKRKASLLIRKGTKAITLIYNIRAFTLSATYPFSPTRSYLEYYDLFYFRDFLSPDFIYEFNEDTHWGVGLHVDSVKIFGIEKNIQSQVFQEPRLVLDGEDLRTGKIKKTFDISALSKDKDVLAELEVFFKRNTNHTRGGEILSWPPTVVAGLQIDSAFGTTLNILLGLHIMIMFISHCALIAEWSLEALLSHTGSVINISKNQPD